jgi:PTH1 family peptidyl-tRNA hydrolase
VAEHPALGLIVGLGNPGEQYARTRHNAGFWFVDRLAEIHTSSFRVEARFKARVCRVDIGGGPVWLLKPDVFMNDSGASVAACAAYYKLSARETLVAHDELSLGCGSVRLKRGGGHGGHNGLRDIVSHFGAGFARVRIGIGHPGAGQDVARYVLNVPPPAERLLIDGALSYVLGRIETIVAGDIEVAAKEVERHPN